MWHHTNMLFFFTKFKLFSFFFLISELSDQTWNSASVPMKLWTLRGDVGLSFPLLKSSWWSCFWWQSLLPSTGQQVTIQFWLSVPSNFECVRAERVYAGERARYLILAAQGVQCRNTSAITLEKGACPMSLSSSLSSSSYHCHFLYLCSICFPILSHCLFFIRTWTFVWVFASFGPKHLLHI